MQHLAEMLSLGCGPIVQCKQQLVEVFLKNMFLKILQILEENARPGVSFY